MRKSLIYIPLFSSLLLLNGCMPKRFQDQVDRAKEEEAQMVAEKQIAERAAEPEDTVITEEQKEVLEEGDQISTEEALNELIEQKESIEIEIPKIKESFTSEQELGQYVSNIFFQYHTGSLNSDEFYDLIQPNLHAEFIELMPTSEEDRREMFQILQTVFLSTVNNQISDYELTETKVDPRLKEAILYRKYNVEYDNPIYYETRLKEVDGVWLIADDGPAPPYEIIEIYEDGFFKPEGE